MSGVEIPTYEFEKLKTATEIRLFNLAPAGDASSGLSGSLTAHELDKVDDRYDAVSYVCGIDPKDVRLNIINQEGKYLMITKHLASALRQLRWKNVKRPLWVDVICIDQDDLKEKARQVNMMRDIYPKARSVYAWMGPANDTIQKAMKALEDVATTRSFSPVYGLVSPDDIPREGLSVAEALNYFLAKNSNYDATLDMITRGGGADISITPSMVQLLRDTYHSSAVFSPFIDDKYFSRRWILQEAILARDLIFMCGNRTLKAEIFHKAVDLLVRLTGDLPHDQWYSSFAECQSWIRVQNVLSVRLRYHQHRYSFTGTGKRGWSGTPYNILQVLHMLEDSNVRDDCDLIYAVMGIAAEVPGFTIDFEEAGDETMKRLAQALLFTNADLRILHYVSDRSELSYVPDWRRKRGVGVVIGSSPAFSAGLEDEVLITRSNDGHPIISGYHIDEIIAIEPGPPVPAGASSNIGLDAGFLYLAFQMLLGIRDWIPIQCPISKSYAEAFSATLLCGYHFPPSGNVLPESLTEDQYTEIMGKILDVLFAHKLSVEDKKKAVTTLDAECHLLLGVIGTLMRDRSFFITEQGYLGLSPRHAEVGDSLVIFSGGKTPFIVRSVLEESIALPATEVSESPSSESSQETDTLVDSESDSESDDEDFYLDKYRLIGESYVHGMMKKEDVVLVETERVSFCII